MNRIVAVALGMSLLCRGYQVGDVLDQLAAEVDLDHLQTAAYSEHGPFRLVKAIQQAELQVVTRGLDIAGHGMDRLTVAGGINVAAAGQQQRVILLGQWKRL
jgi:hypothetical protein